ncbi:haloacid dehalogenase domain-containing protein hydrolase [Stemphylium lycopersici]|uniref:Haloacid dehalogenase domain-containing protein hydrolase n=1 Tax=Stemphylium lycopersici TaxID=183478 RepID=A0A364MRF1_STELY|nr:haloacid dehalogenase domain-containing protein hydrolase [Stemphylium lycopersici]RAR00004.1 haloacid dehalogenase domain-containing protein hydrolase [Stemphylium lycopersici]
MASSASLVGFPGDLTMAEELGFLYLAVGGSRVYQQQDQTSVPKIAAKIQDWDLFGLVNSKQDILDLVLQKEAQLRLLLGIINAEYLTWKILEKKVKLQESWEVLRFAGTTEDGSKRSLKICSRKHLLDVGSEHAVRRFGVLSSRTVRFTHRHHPQDGDRIFIYQPLKLSPDLSILEDADFLHPEDKALAVNPGVTLDLFLTSVPVYEDASSMASNLKAALIRKWRWISKASCVEDMIQLFYRYPSFSAQFSRQLRIEFSHLDGASLGPHQMETRNPERKKENSHYHVICPLSITWDFWSPQHVLRRSTPAPGHIEGDFEFGAAREQYCPSPFTSNSEGRFGAIRFGRNLEWRKVFVKKASHTSDELDALSEVSRYFPPGSVQQLLAADTSTEQLFFKKFEGKMLNTVRLEYHYGTSFLLDTVPKKAVDWFVGVELQRAEHVGDAYRRTMNLDPIPIKCAQQKIHRFYHGRLESDSRFLKFYSEQCLDVLGIRLPKQVNTLSFLNMPLKINGTSYPPLRHYLDQAKRVLDPSATGCLSSLSEAFGLGDGHGGNVMVTEDHVSPRMMYLDYEVSGFHCPFLDMDLLCDNITNRPNKSGTDVTWTINSEGLCIDYNVSVDTIGKATAIIKFEYLLRPLLNLLQKHSFEKANVAEEVLSNSLFACALLSRNFAKRADVFFLNLALGVRLVQDLREVLLEVFGWRWPPAVKLPIPDMVVKTPRSDGAVMDRISLARSAGMKRILGLDLEQRFFHLGHRLYNEDKASSSLQFRQVDMLDPNFKDKTRDLQHQFHFVHTANVIHLFDVGDQKTFFQNLVYLTKPGGIIWGRQVGLAEDNNQSLYKQPEGKGARFTIKEFRDFLRDTTGWILADMQFEAQLVEYDELRVRRMDKNWVLQWSIQVPVRDLSSDRISPL